MAISCYHGPGTENACGLPTHGASNTGGRSVRRFHALLFFPFEDSTLLHGFEDSTPFAGLSVSALELQNLAQGSNLEGKFNQDGPDVLGLQVQHRNGIANGPREFCPTQVTQLVTCIC